MGHRSEHQGYREPSYDYREVVDWDIIIHPTNTVRVIGRSRGVVRGRLVDTEIISSPIMGVMGSPIQVDFYDHGDGGAAQSLLRLDQGCDVHVESGKTYKLIGARKPSSSPWCKASIWRAFAPAAATPAPWWMRLKSWVAERITGSPAAEPTPGAPTSEPSDPSPSD